MTYGWPGYEALRNHAQGVHVPPVKERQLNWIADTGKRLTLSQNDSDDDLKARREATDRIIDDDMPHAIALLIRAEGLFEHYGIHDEDTVSAWRQDLQQGPKV